MWLPENHAACPIMHFPWRVILQGCWFLPVQVALHFWFPIKLEREHLVPTAMASSDKMLENGKWIHFKRQTHFNKTKQEHHFHLITLHFINALSEITPFWKASYNASTPEEATPDMGLMLLRGFQGIYSDHPLTTNFRRVSLGPSREMWPFTENMDFAYFGTYLML